MGDVFVKFRYDARDLVGALRLRMKTGLLTGPVGLLFAGVAAAVLAPPRARPAILAALGVLAALMVLFFAFAFALMPRLALRRRADLQGAIGIDASDEGIAFTAGDLSDAIAWSDVARVESNARVCAIHHARGVLLVPRRAFRDATRERAFFDLLERHVPREPKPAV